MMRNMLRAKIHRATITGADLHYEGSITIDSDLMEKAEMLEHEHVHVWNVTSGTRFETYVIPGQPGSGVVCVNGAAAHMVTKGDRVIVAAFCSMADAEAHIWKPKLVFVDEQNNAVELRGERGGQAELPRAWVG